MKSLVLLLLCVCFVLFLASAASGLEKRDQQVWYANILNGQICDRWRVAIREEFRFGDDVSSLFEQYTELGVSYDAAGWVGVGTDFRHVFKKSRGAWGTEERLQLNIVLKKKRSGLTITDRSRLEHRIFPDKDNRWRYRKKLTVVLPASLVQGMAKPFLAGEVFLDLNESELNQYRIYAGFKGSIVDRLSFNASYLLQATDADDDWIADQILIAILKLSL